MARNPMSGIVQLQSVVKSDFHLYAGSSNGRIVVYALERVCQRPEKHRCHLQDEPHWFCEQVCVRVCCKNDTILIYFS